jgi:hypothetical protein
MLTDNVNFCVWLDKKSNELCAIAVATISVKGLKPAR